MFDCCEHILKSYESFKLFRSFGRFTTVQGLKYQRVSPLLLVINFSQQLPFSTSVVACLLLVVLLISSYEELSMNTIARLP